MKANGVRARVRAEMTEEIKSVARRHLASDGANLSLRAVARDVGMASSAVYRYFAGRDELLTALIIDAYDAVGAAASSAAAPAGPPLQRWLALAHAVRDWALANPHEWALIFGSPVPGYQAPQDTVEPATRVVFAIVAIVRDATAAQVPADPAAGAGSAGAGSAGASDRSPISGRFAEELAALAARYAPEVTPRQVGATFSAYFHLCGAVSGELFGQLTNGIEDDRRGFFDFQMRGAGALMGLASS